MTGWYAIAVPGDHNGGASASARVTAGPRCRSRPISPVPSGGYGRPAVWDATIETVTSALPFPANSGQYDATRSSGSISPRSTSIASTVAVMPLLHEATTISASGGIDRPSTTSVPAHRSTTFTPRWTTATAAPSSPGSAKFRRKASATGPKPSAIPPPTVNIGPASQHSGLRLTRRCRDHGLVNDGDDADQAAFPGGQEPPYEGEQLGQTYALHRSPRTQEWTATHVTRDTGSSAAIAAKPSGSPTRRQRREGLLVAASSNSGEAPTSPANRGEVEDGRRPTAARQQATHPAPGQVRVDGSPGTPMTRLALSWASRNTLSLSGETPSPAGTTARPAWAGGGKKSARERS